VPIWRTRLESRPISPVDLGRRRKREASGHPRAEGDGWADWSELAPALANARYGLHWRAIAPPDL
jgi:hypothetical protein